MHKTGLTHRKGMGFGLPLRQKIVCGKLQECAHTLHNEIPGTALNENVTVEATFVHYCLFMRDNGYKPMRTSGAAICCTVRCFIVEYLII